VYGGVLGGRDAPSSALARLDDPRRALELSTQRCTRGYSYSALTAKGGAHRETGCAHAVRSRW
jgi:hypothetical protein